MVVNQRDLRRLMKKLYPLLPRRPDSFSASRRTPPRSRSSGCVCKPPWDHLIAATRRPASPLHNRSLSQLLPKQLDPPIGVFPRVRCFPALKPYSTQTPALAPPHLEKFTGFTTRRWLSDRRRLGGVSETPKEPSSVLPPHSVSLAASGSNRPHRVHFQGRWFPARMGFGRDGNLHVMPE